MLEELRNSLKTHLSSFPDEKISKRVNDIRGNLAYPIVGTSGLKASIPTLSDTPGSWTEAAKIVEWAANKHPSCLEAYMSLSSFSSSEVFSLVSRSIVRPVLMQYLAESLKTWNEGVIYLDSAVSFESLPVKVLDKISEDYGILRASYESDEAWGADLLELVNHLKETDPDSLLSYLTGFSGKKPFSVTDYRKFLEDLVTTL